MAAPAYHARTHMPGGTDPIPGGGHGPWIELELVNTFTGGPLEYRHAPGSPGSDEWELEWRGHIEGPSGTYCGILPEEDRPPSDKYGVTEGENDDGDGEVVEWYIEAETGFVFITFPVGGGDSGAAEDVSITDTGGYYTGTDVEAALQEVGAALGGASGALTMISDTTLGSDTANFDITSISGSYKHLLVVFQCRSTKAASTADWMTMRFNNDSGSNYDTQLQQDYNTTEQAFENLGQTSITWIVELPAASSASGDAGGGFILIPNYAGTTWNKTCNWLGAGRQNTGSGNWHSTKGAGNWRSTSAITRITLIPTAGNFKTGSRVTLYGIS